MTHQKAFLPCAAVEKNNFRHNFSKHRKTALFRIPLQFITFERDVTQQIGLRSKPETLIEDIWGRSLAEEISPRKKSWNV